MYTPSPLPNVDRMSSSEVVQFFHEELRRVAQEFEQVYDGQFLSARHVEPSKRRDGQLVYADGTDWNPGSGKGFYFYNGSAWIPLHT
jgi:hypothetical protein